MLLEQAKTETGRYIYLTATSTLALEEQVRLGAIEKHHLARRFHGNPLVLPSFFWQGRLQKSSDERQASKTSSSSD